MSRTNSTRRSPALIIGYLFTNFAVPEARPEDSDSFVSYLNSPGLLEARDLTTSGAAGKNELVWQKTQCPTLSSKARLGPAPLVPASSGHWEPRVRGLTGGIVCAGLRNPLSQVAGALGKAPCVVAGHTPEGPFLLIRRDRRSVTGALQGLQGELCLDIILAICERGSAVPVCWLLFSSWGLGLLPLSLSQAGGELQTGFSLSSVPCASPGHHRPGP